MHLVTNVLQTSCNKAALDQSLNSCHQFPHSGSSLDRRMPVADLNLDIAGSGGSIGHSLQLYPGILSGTSEDLNQ